MPIIIDGSTFSSETIGQVEVTGLTVASPDSTAEWQDTTINIPAFSIIDSILIRFTTAGVVSSGVYYVSNFAVHLGAVDGGGYDYELSPGADLAAPGGGGEWGIDTTGNYLAGGMCVVNNFGRSWIALYNSAKNLYWKVVTSAADPSTAAVASILVTYRTFGTS